MFQAPKHDSSSLVLSYYCSFGHLRYPSFVFPFFIQPLSEKKLDTLALVCVLFHQLCKEEVYIYFGKTSPKCGSILFHFFKSFTYTNVKSKGR